MFKKVIQKKGQFKPRKAKGKSSKKWLKKAKIKRKYGKGKMNVSTGRMRAVN